MFHKIKSAKVLPHYRLSISFLEGVTKVYDVNPLFEKIPAFAALKEDARNFYDVSVDSDGYGVVWNDELDLSCEELWKNGIEG